MVTDPELKQILKNSKTIAVIGMSRDPSKAAYQIPKFMIEQGYRIIPVNPFADEILGEKCYKKIAEVKEKIDIVDVFRPSEQCLEVVKEAVHAKPKLIFLQLGIENKKTEDIAKKNKIPIIMDRCLKVEYKRLFH